MDRVKHRWTGRAKAVAAKVAVFPGGLTGTESFSLVVNGQSIVYKADVVDREWDVVAGLARAYGVAAEGNAALLGVEVAEYAPSLMVLGREDGEPLSVTGWATGAATLTIDVLREATGPNHFDNPDNWSGGVVPATADEIDTGHYKAPAFVARKAVDV